MFDHNCIMTKVIDYVMIFAVDKVLMVYKKYIAIYSIELIVKIYVEQSVDLRFGTYGDMEGIQNTRTIRH